MATDERNAQVPVDLLETILQRWDDEVDGDRLGDAIELLRNYLPKSYDPGIFPAGTTFIAKRIGGNRWEHWFREAYQPHVVNVWNVRARVEQIDASTIRDVCFPCELPEEEDEL